MKDTLEEARSALVKAKDDMAHYYNQHRTPTPSFTPGDKVYLDSEDIQTTRPFKKLLYHQLGPYCKGNCGLKKCSKCHTHLRALKSTSRGSEDIQLHNNELEYITYLAGDLKMKE